MSCSGSSRVVVLIPGENRGGAYLTLYLSPWVWMPAREIGHYNILGEQGRERPTLSLVAERGANKGTLEEVAFHLTSEG